MSQKNAVGHLLSDQAAKLRERDSAAKAETLLLMVLPTRVLRSRGVMARDGGEITWTYKS